MEKLTKSLQWIDKHLLKIFLLAYIVLMPIWPKLPVGRVNYTYIAIRVDDFIAVAIVIIFALELLRRRVKLSTKFLITTVLFWAAVLLSFVWGAYVQKTIEFPHLGLLHSLRRIEYMSIFFIAASSIQSKKDFYFYLNAIFIVLGIVSFYGVGQKFLGWPAVQTMNPEFAKGYILTLDAAARISSTFAGHYDFAAYLIFLIPLLLGTYSVSKGRLSWAYFGLFVLVLCALVLTASRVSYIAYLGSVGLYLLFTRKFKLLIVVIALTAVLTPLSDNLTSRLTRTFIYQKIYVDPKTGEKIVPKDLRPDQLPAGDTVIGKIDPNQLKAIDPNAAKTDMSKDATETRGQIADRLLKEASKSGKILTAAELDALVAQEFLKYKTTYKWLPDISQSTRFSIEWPRAIAAFKQNPILGRGPSSITEASDNDYLRWLGEFGVVATSIFLFLIGSIMVYVWKGAYKAESPEKMILLGFVFGTLGLLVNATYIDIFEASKVAYTFWLVAGLFVAAATVAINAHKPAHAHSGATSKTEKKS